jgi:hypothetical protein
MMAKINRGVDSLLLPQNSSYPHSKHYFISHTGCSVKYNWISSNSYFIFFVHLFTPFKKNTEYPGLFVAYPVLDMR